MVASAAPPMILELTGNAGGDGTAGWHNVGWIFGALIALTIFLCWRGTKGGELVTKEVYTVENGRTSGNFIAAFFRNIASIFGVKPAKFLVLSVLLWSVVSSMTSGGLVYLMTSVLGYSAGLQSTCFLVRSLAGIAWLPLINFGSARFDKKRVYITLLISAVLLIAFNFSGFPTVAFVIAYVIPMTWLRG